MSDEREEHILRDYDVVKIGHCVAPLAVGGRCGKACFPTQSGRYLCDEHVRRLIDLVRMAGMEPT